MVMEAAEMGHPGAQQAYGEMLLQKEEREAEEWLRRASNQLQPGARSRCASCAGEG